MGGQLGIGPVDLRALEFLDAIEGDRLYPLYSLAAFAGLRRAEVVGLPWSETDLDGGLITVRETRPDDDADPDDPKSEAGERTVALSAALAALLKLWRKRQLKERMAWGAAWTDSGLVFTREDGAPLRPGHISEHFAVLVRKAGLPPIRFHDLRHGSLPVGWTSRSCRRCSGMRRAPSPVMCTRPSCPRSRRPRPRPSPRSCRAVPTVCQQGAERSWK